MDFPRGAGVLKTNPYYNLELHNDKNILILYLVFRLPYATIFGGAGAFLKKDFENINGFSNEFWGWGGEDDDLYHR